MPTAPHTIKLVSFDADDTLWSSQPLYLDAISAYASAVDVDVEQLKGVHSNTTNVYGDGALALLHTLTHAIFLSAKDMDDADVPKDLLAEALRHTDNIHNYQPTPLPGAEEGLSRLRTAGVAVGFLSTGSVVEQHNKLVNSGLVKFFDMINVVPKKSDMHYSALIGSVGATPSEFVMIGDSYFTDCEPVLSIGGYAILINGDRGMAGIPKPEEIREGSLQVVTSFTDAIDQVMSWITETPAGASPKPAPSAVPLTSSAHTHTKETSPAPTPTAPLKEVREDTGNMGRISDDQVREALLSDSDPPMPPVPEVEAGMKRKTSTIGASVLKQPVKNRDAAQETDGTQNTRNIGGNTPQVQGVWRKIDNERGKGWEVHLIDSRASVGERINVLVKRNTDGQTSIKLVEVMSQESGWVINEKGNPALIVTAASK